MKSRICVAQRQRNDCGVAALATLLGVPYEEIECAWMEALNRKPGRSNYNDLLKVLSNLGIPAKKVRETNWGIRRVRWEAGSNHSHWIVVFGDSLWCPCYGWHQSKDDYSAKHYGHGIEIE